MSLEPPPVKTPFAGERIETTPLAKWLYLLWQYVTTNAGPAGPTGATGATGATGPAGPPGSDATVPAHVAAITTGEIAAWTEAYTDSQAIPGTEVTREAQISPMVLTGAGSAPPVGNLVDANMKAYRFSGTGPSEELAYSWDLQHDYKADSNVVFHIHWCPTSTGSGNVYFKVYYLWEVGGTVIPAATLVTSPAIASGGVAWSSKRTDFTIPGIDKTYNARLLVRVIRDPGDAEDTYGDPAALVSIGCHYTAIPLQP